MKKLQKKNSGITLVALVITIVILIILAGITISLTLGNDGIFNRAKTATQEYANAQAKEETEIAKYTNEIGGYINGNREQIMVDKTKYEQLVKDVDDLKANATQNNFETPIALNSYTSYENSYTFPSNGYLSVYASGSSYISALVYGQNSTNASDTHLSFQIGNPNGNTTNIAFVKEGMKVYIYNASGTTNVVFIPLI